MIRRSVQVQLAVFGALGIGSMTYAGLTVVAPQALQSPYVVKADFADSGGIFSNAEVTYRGVNVGRVGPLELQPDGVRVSLRLDEGTQVPDDVEAVVANKSAVGEQYVDLRPGRQGPPYLSPGAVIPQSATSIPTPITDLLRHLDSLSTSVNKADLATVVDELSKGFAGTGPSLDRLLTFGDSLTKTLSDSLPDTITLINASKVELQTASDTSRDLAAYSKGLALLSDQLVASDPDFRRLLDNGVDAAKELDQLLDSAQPALYPLLGNLITVNQIQAARLPGLRQTLLVLPEATQRLTRAVHGNQLYNGLVTDPITTNCVYTTQRRLPAERSQTAADTDEYCPTGATDPRGARNAPRPQGDTTAGPGSDNGGAPSGPLLTTYDPGTGLVRAPDGGLVELSDGAGGLVGQQHPWAGLLLALVQR